MTEKGTLWAAMDIFSKYCVLEDGTEDDLQCYSEQEKAQIAKVMDKLADYELTYEDLRHAMETCELFAEAVLDE